MSFSDSDVLKTQSPSKDLAWWVPNIDHRITPKIRNSLETYSGIAPDKVVDHIYNIREQAWNIRPWPCTGMGLFFSSSLPKLPCYNDILCRIKSGGVFLDLGCHCGTDLRQLMFDGCPQTNLYGMDLVDHWRLGYALYRDEGRFNVKYIKADLLNPSMELFALTDKIDVMGATHLLHNWDWTTQIRGATTMIKLSKVGTMIVGFQIGTVNEGLTWSLENGKDRPILHNLSTFGRVWDEAAKITGTEWRVSSRLREWKDLDYDSKETVYLGGDSCILEFIIRRIS